MKLLGTRRRRLLGGRRHARGVPPRARGHPRRPDATRAARASSSARACGSGRAPTSRPTPMVHGPVLIGDNSRVEAGAVLAPVHRARRRRRGEGRRASSSARSCTTTCYIGHVGAACAARSSGAPATSATHAHIEEGVVIGDECFVGARAIINPSVKIYPFKMVEAGALVTSSIVWESKGARTLFGRRGVRGLANVDITSEVAVRLAMAYGTALKKGSVVCTSRDTSRVGPRAQAGDHRRPQPERRARDGPRAVDGAAHPVPGAHRAGAGRHLGAARLRRPRQRRDPVLRRVRRRHRRGRAAQDRAAALPRRLPPRVRGRHRRHRVPAARDRVLHGRARSERRRRAAARTARSRSCSTTRSARRRS